MVDTIIDSKMWTVLNRENGEIKNLNHVEFKNLINVNALQLTGQYIEREIHFVTKKIWIDAVFKKEYL